MVLLAVVLWLALPRADAHVGSPDVFLEGKAGPYPLFIAIRPPLVIPGVAQVEIRTSAKDVSQVRIVPLPMTGAGAKFAPTPDLAERSKDDPQFFTGSLWMMTSGSWQVRVSVEGGQGKGELAVPVPALANKTERMQTGLAILLSILGLVLCAGAVSIAGAASREAKLEPGQQPTPEMRQRARRTMVLTALLVIAVLYLGNAWWTAEANSYGRIIYKPLRMDAALVGGSKLQLTLSDPGWLGRRVDDFVPDHNHLMHLYVIRLPEMERVWHLHPEMTASGVFTHDLPPMPAGSYALFADVVHESGLPETMVAEITLPAIAGKPLSGDDSAGSGHPLSQADPKNRTFVFEDGSKMIWERSSDTFPVKRAHAFRFRVEGPDGQPVPDMELYMGMLGHAAFVKRDRSVFAHVHPTGSVPMAALSLAQKSEADPHAGHHMHAMALPSEVTFPYGFPQPGDYRVFIQIRRSGKVQTAMFDTVVEDPNPPSPKTR
ncbi:MAG: hypothetical protein NZV14_00935 [Bryobacteraceae bacterium]|nr:hypothetical protein [Bryobacteraceae bacterium]MDW8376694.1 hypothetical protein [Bryobacterales bacterium]